MSASPRKLLRRAADALRQIAEIAARYPDARAELDDALGPGGVAALGEVATALDTALVRVEARRAVGGVDPALPGPPGPRGAPEA